MASNRLNYEEYPAIGDALIAGITRDSADFAQHYKNMDATFITQFQTAIDDVRAAASILAKTEELKNVTKDLYTLADEANSKLLFLLDYAADANLDTKTISTIRKKLTNRNIEGATQDIRQLLPYLEDHKDELDGGDMPKSFLDYFPSILPTMEALNAEQIAIISTRKSLVEDNQALFDDAYSYISKTITRGKKVFKKTIKKEDYTLAKLLTRVRSKGNKNDNKNDNPDA